VCFGGPTAQQRSLMPRSRLALAARRPSLLSCQLRVSLQARRSLAALSVPPGPCQRPLSRLSRQQNPGPPLPPHSLRHKGGFVLRETGVSIPWPLPPSPRCDDAASHKKERAGVITLRPRPFASRHIAGDPESHQSAGERFHVSDAERPPEKTVPVQQRHRRALPPD